VTDQNPFTIAGDDVPHANRRVVTSRYESTAASRKSANSMIMSLEVELVIRIVFNVLLTVDMQVSMDLWT